MPPQTTARDHVGTDVKPDYVGIYVDPSKYGRDLVLGAAAVLNRESDLRPVTLDGDRFDTAPFAGRYAGLIGLVRADQLRSTAMAAGIPLVNVSSAGAGLDLPSVVPDDRAIGRLAAEVLLRRGYRHLVGVYLGKERFERERHAGFAEVAATRAADYHRLESPRSSADAIDVLAGHLAGVPRPCGVLAANDRRARLVLAAAAQLGWAVPAEAAVVGVDDDDVTCCLQRPELSSVDPDGRRIGATAAEVLLALIAGRPGPPAPIVVPPLALVERTSTSAIVTRDRIVAAALRTIDADPTLGVEAIAAAVHLGRRALERRFRLAGAGTVRDAIRDARLVRARRLLADPDLTLEHVAGRLGYGSGRTFAAAFAAATGVAPTAWRELHRAW